MAVFGLGMRANAQNAAAIPPVPGEVVTQYSMRYIEVAIGTGKLAEPGKVYVVQYTGWLRDGTKFDSSRDRPEPLSFEQGKRKVIPGWDAGFEGMRVGGKRRFLIPYQLAYGEKGRGKIPPKAELIFDVELMDVKDPPPDPAAAK
jgi:peptidylprolyl isomerase